jgi:hypothetical protein
MSYKKFVLVPYTNYQTMVDHKCITSEGDTDVQVSSGDDKVNSEQLNSVLDNAVIKQTAHNKLEHTIKLDSIKPTHVVHTHEQGDITNEPTTSTQPDISVVKKTKTTRIIYKTKPIKVIKKNGMIQKTKTKTKFNWLSIG